MTTSYIRLFPCQLLALSSLPIHFENMFLKKLRDCEDELVSSLSKVDAQELCVKFFGGSVLSRESHAHFTSLDHSRLKHQLQVRYLVRLASERVKTDPALGHNLIEVLDTLEGVPSSLTDKLNKAMADTNEGPTDDSDTVGGLSATAVGEASEEKDIVLTREDTRLLTELLSKISHKWKEIAISLGLQQHEIECNSGSSAICLYNVVRFWLANHSNTTLNKLTDTLCSGLVNESRLAKSVAEEVKKCNEVAKANLRSKRSKGTSGIVSQSVPTKVADGKSTLLQVQARPRESVVSYQWNKDGQPLANSSRYSGVDEDILVVRHASQGTEGEYMCCVSLQDRQVTSNTITLTVHFPPAKEILLNRYSNLKEVPNFNNDWPPVVANTFINLALVKSSSNKVNNTDLCVQAGADNIIDEREKIEYDEVFGEHKSNELILVEGRPGSGKTTLVHKVIKDWASGKALAKSKLTLLLTLRLLNDGQDETLEKVLQTLYSDEDAIAILHDIRDGEGVCFLLDGLDEYQPQNREKSVILKLLHRNQHHRSMITIFTRPSATERLSKDLITKTIEVFGFKKEQISEYIDNFPFDEEGGTSDSSITKAGQLKEYLHSYPNIHDMCYLPIHAAMICFLFRFAKNVSATQTKVYEEFTRWIIQRHLARYKNCKALDSLKDLDGDLKKYLKDLCHLAYEMTIKSKQVINAKELQVQLGGSGSLSEEGGLGLLTICPTLYQTGFHQSYAFLHLTFQEFLTAYYIANYMNISRQLKVLKKYSEMKTVWLFFSGLANFEKTPKILDELFSQDMMELCRYALESQSKTLSNKILENKLDLLYFYQALIPTDLLSIKYVIETSSRPIKSINVRSYGHDHNRMRALLQQLQEANVQQLRDIWIQVCDDITNSLCELLQTATNIGRLNLNIKHTHSCCAKELALQINHCTKLFFFIVSYSGTPECIQTFFSSLSLSTLQWSLYLEKLDGQRIRALGNGLQHFHTELKLTVFESDINEDDMTSLVDGLQNIKSLHLNLSHNNIYCSGIISLAERLSSLKLRDLKLSRTNIGPDGAIALAGGIKSLTELGQLDLSHNNIGPDGAIALAGGIKSLTELGRLDLSHNNIGPDGAIALAGGLKSLTKLNRLDLSHNNIGPAGATALAGGMKYLTILRRCNISYNSVDVAAAKTVMTSLKKCDYLLELTIADNLTITDYQDSLLECHYVRHVSICNNGLVSPDDTSTISELVEAAQHENKIRTLDLGFKTIKVPPPRKFKCVIM